MNSFLVELHVALLKFENFSDNFFNRHPCTAATETFEMFRCVP